MRLLAIVLAAFIVLLQWPLWVGKGSWLKVWQIQHDVEMQKAKNTKLTARNAALDAEVRDLKTGTDAIEERARNELGMVRQDEVFYQILDPHAQGGTLTAPVAAAPSTLNGAATAPITGAASPAPSADHSVKP